MTNTDLLVALAAGLVAGAGLLLVLKGLLPGRPALGAALARMAGTDRPPQVDVSADTTLTARVGARVTARIAVPRLPTSPSPADLDLAGVTAHAHLGEKVLAAGLGILVPTTAAILLALTGTSLPAWLMVLVGALLVVGGWIVPDLDVTSRAARARDELDRAVAALIELVAVQRLAGAGVAQAVKQAVAIGTSEPFERCREAVAQAEINGEAPWDGLDHVADQLDDPRHPGRTQSLHDTAAICRQAAKHGSHVADQLAGRARSMRGTQTSADRARANAASVTMTAPMSLTVIVVALAIVAPLGWLILTQ